MRVVLATALLLLAGCGSSETVTVTVTSSGAAGPVPTTGATAGLCTVGKVGQAVNVTFNGYGADEACRAAVRAWSGGASGSFWRVLNASGTERLRAATETVCTLKSAENGDLVVDILDAGGQFEGLRLCGEFTHRGWLPLF